MEYGSVFVINALVVAALMFATWRLSLRWHDASVVDVVWGPGLALVALTTWLVADGAPVRENVLLALTAVWGLRLGAHLGWRKRGHPEDKRYQAMRRRQPDFERRSLYTVFFLQGALMWIVALPVQIGMVPDTPTALTIGGVLGVVVWLVGMAFETVGDLQLARFRASPANDGRLMTEGLWRYTRHPNYFGDFAVWWGIFIVAATNPVGLAGIAGPLLVTVLLMKVSGVPLAEREQRRKPGWDDYAARTNQFFPGPPRADDPSEYPL